MLVCIFYLSNDFHEKNECLLAMPEFLWKIFISIVFKDEKLVF